MPLDAGDTRISILHPSLFPVTLVAKAQFIREISPDCQATGGTAPRHQRGVLPNHHLHSKQDPYISPSEL